jgi:hypothetical protein
VSIGGPIVKKISYLLLIMKLTREDSGSNFVANDGNGTTDVNESRVLATDLMHVSTELGKLGYNTGATKGLHII